MNDHHIKQQVQNALQRFATSDSSMLANATALLNALGYRSNKTLELVPNTVQGFQDVFPIEIHTARALTDEWQSVDFVFQLTDDEMQHLGQTGMPFGTTEDVDQVRIYSYMFFAIRLTGDYYTRTQLAGITRELNRHFPMPVLILFQHGDTLTIAIINRRVHKRDDARDVLEKVTLIKDIHITEPHRGHLDILYDLALPAILQEHTVRSFVDLQRIWGDILSSSELNKRFYRDIANWYFWATQNVTFPAGTEPNADQRTATNIIRLITRLIFVWFVKEKGLIPGDLFDERKLKTMLNDMSPDASSYYKAILQNLFFATLNQEMGKREFRKKHASGGRDQNRLITTLYRYQDYFQPAGDTTMLDLMRNIPFLDGGLFDCLDYEELTDDSGSGPPSAVPRRTIRIDGFSDEKKNPLAVPNKFFFGGEQDIDLNATYDTKGKRYKVRGLIHTLNRYKFTVTENTPIEDEIALDPELLGQVFENLLAAYNPETGATARKQTGSFYTPRDIVSYMVDESLLAYLSQYVAPVERLAHLLAYNNTPPQFNDDECQRLIHAIDQVKILDPACGSGAFLIGILQKLVFVLGKLDPRNELWRAEQIAKANRIDESNARDLAIETIEKAFAYDSLDYARKLYLIQNCIYGVDIQPIAMQIAKLRCFIALIVDQQADDSQENRGMLALPNLETRFIAANTLIGADVHQGALRSQTVINLETELATVRRYHFNAKTPDTKRKYRERDRSIRQQISAELKRDGVEGATADMLAQWDPYDQNATAPFFDAEWMFGAREGFDVVLGNPPYVRQEQIKHLKDNFKKRYSCYTGTADLYVYFYERGIQVLKNGGILTYISSNQFFRAAYAKKLRQFFSSHMTMHKLVDFGDAKVFTAIVSTCILVISKAKPNNQQVQVLLWEPERTLSDITSALETSGLLVQQQKLNPDGWQLEQPNVLHLLDKLRQAGTPLGEYVQGKLFRGIITGLNEAFVVDQATRDRLIAEDASSAEVLKPFLRGRDVRRWRVNFAEQYLIKIESSENKTHPWSGKPEQEAERLFAKTYPAIHAWFDNHRPALIKRLDQGRFFWELRSCAYWQEFEQSKIIYPDIARSGEFVYDNEGYYLANTNYFLPTNQKWLVGLLNSKVVFWFYAKISSQLGGKTVRFFSQYVSQIPIPTATPAQQAPIVKLVDDILAAKQANPDADVSALEADIDAHVYRLYGLTDEEIRVVAGE